MSASCLFSLCTTDLSLGEWKQPKNQLIVLKLSLLWKGREEWQRGALMFSVFLSLSSYTPGEGQELKVLLKVELNSHFCVLLIWLLILFFFFFLIGEGFHLPSLGQNKASPTRSLLEALGLHYNPLRMHSAALSGDGLLRPRRDSQPPDDITNKISCLPGVQF